MIFSHANYHTIPAKMRMEFNSGISDTIPEMTLDLRTLVEMYTRGQAIPVKQPQFIDDPLIPDDFEMMDEVERQQLANDIGQAARHAMDTVRQRDAEAKRKKEEKPAAPPTDEPPAPAPAM